MFWRLEESLFTVENPRLDRLIPDLREEYANSIFRIDSSFQKAMVSYIVSPTLCRHCYTLLLM